MGRRGRAEREEDMESEAGSRLGAVSTKLSAQRLTQFQLMNREIMGQRLNRLSHAGAPKYLIFDPSSGLDLRFLSLSTIFGSPLSMQPT